MTDATARKARTLFLDARRTRSQSQALRAVLRAGRLQSRALVRDSRASRAAVQAAKLIARLRGR